MFSDIYHLLASMWHPNQQGLSDMNRANYFFLLSGCKSTLRLHQTDWTTNSRFKWTEHQSNNWTSNPTLSAWCTNLGILTLAKNSWELIWMRNWLLQDKRRFVIIFWISITLTFDFKKSWKIKKIDLNTLIKVMINSRAGMNDKVWLLTKYFLGFFIQGLPHLHARKSLTWFPLLRFLAYVCASGEFWR